MAQLRPPTVHPTSDGAPCGRLARHAFLLGCSTPDYDTLPPSQPALALAGGHGVVRRSAKLYAKNLTAFEMTTFHEV